ncbi:MAG: transcriptional repressor LexA [Sphingobium sp.]|nr:transcriptional repressor LexA [Sphingobium sp.]
MLTAKQQELLVFIARRLEEGGVSPSFDEMKDALDLRSKSGIHRLVSALEERGFIRRLPNRARALEVLKLPDGLTAADLTTEVINAPAEVTLRTSAPSAHLPAAPNTVSKALPVAANDVIEIPLHGRIAAGIPVEALEGQAMLSVPAALLGSGDHYALEVSGDSMVDAGILDGDYALIQRTDVAREGQIIVALIDDNEATLKYFRRENGRVRLDPANPAYEPQVYNPEQVRIQGKLAGLLRRYH